MPSLVVVVVVVAAAAVVVVLVVLPAPLEVLEGRLEVGPDAGHALAGLGLGHAVHLRLVTVPGVNIKLLLSMFVASMA